MLKTESINILIYSSFFFIILLIGFSLSTSLPISFILGFFAALLNRILQTLNNENEDEVGEKAMEVKEARKDNNKEINWYNLDHNYFNSPTFNDTPNFWILDNYNHITLHYEHKLDEY